MNKQESELIKKISADCYDTVAGWIKDNWRKTIPYPVDNYIHHGGKYDAEIKELIDTGHEDALSRELHVAASAAIIATEIRDPLKLERNEFMLCVDATNGFMLTPDLEIKEQIYAEVRDFIHIEKADEKWQVDKNKLLEKLENATEEEYEKLWLQIQQFWAKRDRE